MSRGTTVRKVRVPDDLWDPAEVKATAEGTDRATVIRVALEAFLAAPARDWPSRAEGTADTVEVPARFWDHHTGRGLNESAHEVSRTSRKVRVILSPAGRAELLADARHHAGDAMAAHWEDSRGVILSARATVKALA